MKRHVLVFISVVIVTSCSKPKWSENNFISIDFSRSNGWNYFYSIKVDSVGDFILKKVQHTETPQFFKGHLADSLLSKIIVFSDSIIASKYDTLYEVKCMDCSSYQIIIGTRSNYVKHKVRGNFSLYFLDSLENTLTQFCKSGNFVQIDTFCEFESFKNLLPPPIIETIKFTPPTVE